jgi:hypothetical protein
MASLPMGLHLPNQLARPRFCCPQLAAPASGRRYLQRPAGQPCRATLASPVGEHGHTRRTA